MDLHETLNKTLVVLFNQILNIEEKMLITDEFSDISVNDMHILDAIGIDRKKNMGTVAKALSVTTGTLTITVNSLVKKGYAERSRSEQDKRVVYLHLTPKGKKAYEHHLEFHAELTGRIARILTEQELDILIRSLNELVDEL